MNSCLGASLLLFFFYHMSVQKFAAAINSMPSLSKLFGFISQARLHRAHRKGLER